MTRTFGRSGRKWARPIALALVLATTTLSGLTDQPKSAAAAGGVKAGLLTCHSRPDTRVNWVAYSSVELNCVFDTAGGQERYTGKTGIRLGMDLAWRPETELRFVVLMASTDVEIGSHSLAGFYGGGNVSASVGSSAGASVLIGGGPRNVSLQPLAVETGSGLGVAAGLSYLVLSASR